ncbi:phosphatase PAP2 family protein [Alkalihalobacillus sp. AL-G]|uniref:phosphatase PAP2 family protein n=1 Tax=Alkalihalobacillus sp. AL-G TaxID=2926399 RepID=UPI00272CAF75|nr:phosphatase PAP2 family protein [Alkalihalobacillus sp. AL-G]WLD92449.1 phosphatase PAP2 family protein [Alkalihalobacillus sp. AL-G]
MDKKVPANQHQKWFRFTFAIAIVLIILFIVLGYFHETLTKFDIVIMEQIWDLRNGVFTQFFILITYVGSAYVSYPLLIVLSVHFFVNGPKRLSVILIFNLVGVRYMNGFLKDIYGRTRPDGNPLVDVGGLSFPSGHTMNSTAFIGLLSYILWIYLSQNGINKNNSLVVTGVLIFLIGLSRVYLGVHYPSDVIAGFAAGGIWLLLSMVLLRLWVPRSMIKIDKNRSD